MKMQEQKVIKPFDHQEVTSDKLPLIFELKLIECLAWRSMRLILLRKRSLKKSGACGFDNAPHMVAYERFVAAAYVGSPYAHVGIGWPSDLNNLTIDDVRKWYKAWYGPNNAVVVVAGDVNLYRFES